MSSTYSLLRVDYKTYMDIRDRIEKAGELSRYVIQKSRDVEHIVLGEVGICIDPEQPEPSRQSEHSKRVEEFMQKAGQAVPLEPFYPLPTKETIQLRAKLELEECLEKLAALGVRMYNKPLKEGEKRPMSWEECLARMDFRIVSEPNLEEILDAHADQRVISTGTLLAFGFRDDEVLQEEVDAANLRKFEAPTCPSCKGPMHLAEFSMDDTTYLSKGLIESVTEDPIRWICNEGGQAHPTLRKEDGPYTRADGKHIKPPYWTPPNIKQFLP